MKMRKKVIGIILVILFAYMYAHVAKTEAVDTEFVCSVENLDGIAVKCRVPEEKLGTTVRMTLIDITNDRVAITAEMEAQELKDGKYNVFSFERIQGCEGCTYKVLVDEIEMVSVKTVTKGFDIETFGVFLFLILYIVFFFKFLTKLFSR